MKDENMVAGMNFVTKPGEFECKVCAKCKLLVRLFKNSTNREKEVLGLIYSDICNSMNTESLGETKYFATFTDDYTGYTETAMLRNRSEVLKALKDYKRKVETNRSAH